MSSSRSLQTTDLELAIGLPIRLEPDRCEPIFGEGVVVGEVATRSAAEMEAVCKAPVSDGVPDLYHMYRGVSRASDAAVLAQHGLRFDLTIMRPGRLGDEYVKTLGHYHIRPSEHRLAPPEAYFVIEGQAWFLFQDDERAELEVVEAGRGDAVIVPPGAVHVTVNVGAGPLVLADWIRHGCKSDYEGVAQRRGAAYYVVEREGEPRLEANSSCERPYRVRRAKAGVLPGRFGFARDTAPYPAVLASPARYEYLVRPDDYRNFFCSGEPDLAAAEALQSRLAAATTALREIAGAASGPEMMQLADAILASNSIFVTGQGRTGLIARAFANRLMQLGLRTFVVGDVTTPGIAPGDLLLACSGSGETASILIHAGRAKGLQAFVVGATRAQTSSLASLSDLVLYIPAAGQTDSVLPGGTLFEQALLVILDGLVTVLMERLGQREPDLLRRHANLE